MAKKKTSKKTASKKPTRSSNKSDSIQPATLAVYAILAILVIGTSFYTGYLVGKSGDEIQTGTQGVDKLTVIEYSDFQCPFCQRAVPTVQQIKDNYDNVEVVYKHFPLESIHPDAFNAAVASECVREEGGDEAFWDYHDILFENQQSLDTASLKQYASRLGLDISSCLDNQETAGIVRADMQEAQQRGVSGTPSFWVHDELIVGAVPYSQLSTAIDQKLSGDMPPRAPTQPQQQAPPQQAERADVKDGNYVLGDDNAPVTIVEFTDFQCPFCKRAHDQTFPQIMSEYIDEGQVRYTVRHYPLPFHTEAAKASEAAECAGKLGGSEAFFAYSDLLFENQANLQVSALKGYASELELDQQAFDACLDNGEFTQLVEDDLARGRELEVSGTPTFFVNGNKIVGAQPYSAFKAAIDAELN